MIYQIEHCIPKQICRKILTDKTIANRKEEIRYIRIGCGFDIETTKILNNKGEQIASYCYHWQFSCGGNYVTGRKLDSMQVFFQSLIDEIKNMGDKIRILVWVANLGYEWQFCKKYWYYLGIGKLFCKEVRDPLKFILGDVIEFRECIGLMGYSLQDIASKYSKTDKLYGYLDYDQKILSNTPMTDKEIKYCIADVQILADMGGYIFDHYFGKNANLPLTSTGLIRNKIKNRIGKKLSVVKRMTQMHMPCEEDFYFLRKWGFKGGICGTNIEFVGELLHGVTCADLKSDYPAQMLQKKFPMGFCMRCDPVKFMSEDRPYIAHIRFHNLKSTTSHALFSSSKSPIYETLDGKNSIIDNGRVVYAQEIEFVLTDVEFEGFNQAYTYDDDLEILRCWEFDEYGYLPDYVTDVIHEQYAIKSELDQQGKKGTMEYNLSKIFVNGIFGMFATALFPFDKQLDGTKNCNIKLSKNKKSYHAVTKNLFLNPFWAFWVTSYARNILIDVITKYPDAIVQYDTDSVYFIAEYKEEIKQYLGKHNDKIKAWNDKMIGDKNFTTLGTWEIDPPSKKFKGLGAKRYCYETNDGKLKTVVCGCRKGTIEKMIKIKTVIKYYDENGIKFDPNDKKLNEKMVKFYDENWNKSCMSGKLFDEFKDSMYIPPDISGKMTSYYIDDTIECDYTDREGNTEHLVIPSCQVLEPTAFSMKMHKLHLQLAEEYKSFESLAKNSRVMEIMEKRGIGLLEYGMPVDHDEKWIRKQKRKKEKTINGV